MLTVLSDLAATDHEMITAERHHRPNTPKDVIQIFSHVMQQMNVFPKICLSQLVTSIGKSIEVQQHLICLLKP